MRGQRPASTRKREDLPQPLGPMIMTHRPGGTSKLSSRTKGVPSGELSATLHSTARLWVLCTSASQLWSAFRFYTQPACAVRILDSMPWTIESSCAKLDGLHRCHAAMRYLQPHAELCPKCFHSMPDSLHCALLFGSCPRLDFSRLQVLCACMTCLHLCWASMHYQRSVAYRAARGGVWRSLCASASLLTRLLNQLPTCGRR